jgi:hypothetical protein
MKKILVLIVAFAIVSSCTEGFEELNVDPNSATQIDPEIKFTFSLLSTAGDRYENWRANIIYSSYMIQHMANPSGLGAGDRYLYNAQWSGAWMERGFSSHVRNIEDIIDQLQNDEEGRYTEEMLAIARIHRVFTYHKITDLYGDIPYSEAGAGFSEGIFRPAYDPQSEIYADMLNELAEATAVLGDGTSQFGAADIMFNGDLGKWRRFGYSMMLRLGLRLIKVDPAAAQEWAQRAINGGVMESNDDIAFIIHTSGPEGINQNGNGQVFQADGSMRLSETFVNALQGDPRMRIYAALPIGDINASGSNDPDVQRGLPNGLDLTTVQDIPGGDDLSNFSEPNRNFLTGLDDPYFFQTYAEVEFMLAEANIRWGIGGDAEGHYNAGIEAAMRQLDLYGLGNASITDMEIADYLAANPYDAANGLVQVNTQYWIVTFLNHIEAYSNWRRTGIPTLIPNDYPGNESNGQIPRRLRYFENEQIANPDSYQAAISRQGPDQFFTRIWWDVE